jgi:hypothetical protein
LDATHAGFLRGLDLWWICHLIPELCPTRLRSTGIGFCYNVARYITALGPLTLGKLAVLYAGMGFAVPLRPAAITLSSIFLVGVVTVLFAPETKDKPLPE